MIVYILVIDLFLCKWWISGVCILLSSQNIEPLIFSEYRPSEYRPQSWGNLSPRGRGNPRPGAGGTRRGKLHPLTSKKLSKNPSRQSLVREKELNPSGKLYNKSWCPNGCYSYVCLCVMCLFWLFASNVFVVYLVLMLFPIQACLEGFLLNFLKGRCCNSPRPVPPAPVGRFPQPQSPGSPSSSTHYETA